MFNRRVIGMKMDSYSEWSAAALAGNSDALNVMDDYRRQGTQDKKIAGELKQTRIILRESTNSHALYLAGYLSQFGMGGGVDLGTAIACYDKAIKLGNQAAMYLRASLYRQEGNYKAASALYQTTAAPANDNRLIPHVRQLIVTDAFMLNALMNRDKEGQEETNYAIHYLNFFDHELKFILLSRTSGGFNALMLALLYHQEKVVPILEAMRELSPDERASILSNGTETTNALIMAIMQGCHASILPLLEAMDGLSPEQKASILISKGSIDWDQLMAGADGSLDQAVVIRFFEVIKDLSHAQKEKLFTQNKTGHNICHAAAKWGLPLTLLLPLIDELLEDVQEKILTEVTSFQQNILTIAIENKHKEAVLMLLEKIATLSITAQKKIFNQIPIRMFAENKNALGLAKECLPSVVGKIQAAMFDLFGPEEDAQLKKVEPTEPTDLKGMDEADDRKKGVNPTRPSLSAQTFLSNMKFDSHFKAIKAKADEMAKKSKTKRIYCKAAIAAAILCESLEKAAAGLNAKEQQEGLIKDDFNVFKKTCIEAIKLAKPALEEHRGWARILTNLMNAILKGLNATGLFHFGLFRTDAAKKVDAVEAAVSPKNARGPGA